MEGRLSTNTSRKLALLFLVVVAPPAITLVWLGLQLLDQDRSLWAQRELESLQVATQSISRSLEQSLAEAERISETPLPEGMVRFTLSPFGMTVEPAGRVLWLPVTPRLEEADEHQFIEAEKLEFQGGTELALLTYRQMTQSAISAVRAGALLRLARVHRRAERWNDSLAAYRQLSKIDGIAIDGMPADLLARRAICFLLVESGRKTELDQEAALMETDFLSGRWILDQPAWELTSQQLEEWRNYRLIPPAESREFSAIADWLWSEGKQNPENLFLESSRRLIIGEMTLVLHETEAGVSVIVISPLVLFKWMEKALRGGAGDGDRLSLLTPAGQLLAGPQLPSGSAAVNRRASETGLPWTLVLSPGDSSPRAQELAERRRLLSLGLLAIVFLLAGGSYFLYRVIRRELAIARLQTEFVSAVSHEFRTPLASLRHVTELMQEDDNLPPERRKLFYEAIGRNTERLHHLVESLLDFARMEGKRKPYDLQPLDAGEFAAQVVADFRKDVEPRGFIVDLDVADPGPFPLRADADSLANALWNLLDNAVKYSPDVRNICVSVRRHPKGLAIAVRDYGLGILPREQKEVFRQFVRGQKVSRMGIKGTGLGLAMVNHIVRAHGGTIELESKEGVGSTFRMVLPTRV